MTKTTGLTLGRASRWLRAGIGLACVLCAFAAPARAEHCSRDDVYRHHADQGQLAERTLDYRRALQEFERAWARCATPRIAFNRARMLHQLGRWPEAADWYQRAGRTAGDDAELSAKVRQRIAELPTGLAPAVGPRPAAAGPQTARTPPAPLTLDIPAPNPKRAEALSAPTSGGPAVAEANANPPPLLGVIRLEPPYSLPLAPAPTCCPVPASPSPLATVPAAAPASPPVTESPKKKSVTRWLPWTLLALGVSGGAIALGVSLAPTDKTVLVPLP